MNTFMKKSSYLFLASTILASTAATTVGVTGGIVAKAEVINEAKQGSTIDFKTTLKNNFVTKNDQISFDVWAAKEDGETLLDWNSSNVELLTEQDNTYTSSPIMDMTDYSIKKIHYTLDLKEGQNTITLKIKNGDDVLEKTFYIFKETAQENEVMQDVVFSVEAFNLGIGYIVEPKRISVAYDETYTINSLLEKEDLSLENDGAGETLISATNAKLTEKTTINVDDELVQALHIEGVRQIDLEASGIGDINDGLGVYDFSPVATWKVTKNNSFENFGNWGDYSNIIISEKDVIRTQFTFGGGLELDALDNKNTIDRDEATRALAYINSSEEKATILANKDVKEAYDDVMQTIQTFGISQQDIDEKVAALNEAVTAWLKLNDADAQKAYLEDLTDAQLKLWLAPFNEKIAQLPSVTNLTLADYDKINDLDEALAIYSLQQRNVIDNYQTFLDAKDKMDTLIQQKITNIENLIGQLPQDAKDVTLEIKEMLNEIDQLYTTIPEAYRNKIDNYNVYQNFLKKVETNKKQAEIDWVNQLINNLSLNYIDQGQVGLARQAYDKLSDLQKSSVENYSKLTYAEVEIVKNAISSLENYITLNQSSMIENIRKQYDALSSEQQKSVSNYEKLVEAEEQLKTLKDNESRKIQSIIEAINALPAIDNLQLSDLNTVHAIREDYNNLTLSQQQLVQNIETLKKAENKLVSLTDETNAKTAEVQKKINDLPATWDITLDDESLVKDVRKAYTALTLAQQKNILNMYQLIDAENMISQQKNAVENVINKINSLPKTSDITSKNASEIEEVSAMYQALKEVQKKYVINYDALKKAEDTLAELSEDIPRNVSKVINLIAQLPNKKDVTLSDEWDIANVRAFYDELTAKEKQQVDNATKLFELEAYLKALEVSTNDETPSSTTDFSNLTGTTKTVAQLINTLPSVDKITLDNGAVLNATYKAFSALSKAEQEKIPNAFTLVIAKAIYDDLQLEEDRKVAKKEIAKIASLPTVSLVDLSDEAAIAEAKAAYAQLDANQKALVTNYATITQLETQIASLKTAALNVQQTISALPSASLITENNRSAIETARAKYTALTTSQKKLVKNVALLDAAEQKLAENQTETVKKLINTINEWPNDITLNEESAIQEARKTYNALPSLQQKAITNYATLLNAETQLAALLNTDRATAEVVDAMINDLPFTITAKDQEAVEQARKAYRALTASQKLYVTNISVLDKAEATLLAAADNDLKAAKAVVTAIDSLPNEQVVTIEDADNVVAVRDAYRQLTTTQKGYVDNYDTLKAIEAALTKVEAREKALKAADVEIDIPTVKNTTKTIEGYVTPGAKVAVYIGSKKIATAKVDKDGYYTVNISRQQAGKELKFIVFNEVGDKLLREYIKVKAATVTAASSLKASPTKISGKAPKNKTVTIYKRSKKLKTTKSTANGKFSVKLPKQAKGTTLKVIVSDSVGNKSKSKSVKVK